MSQDSFLSSQMRAKLSNVALAGEKNSVSDRSASVLINADLKEMRVIIKEDTSKE